MFNGSGRFPFTITEILQKQSAHRHLQREGTQFDFCPSPSSTCVRVPVLMSCCRAGPPAHLALTVGTQAGRGWICHARRGRGGWVLLLPAHCTVGMPCLSPVWHRGLGRPFAAVPAASLLLQCHCCFSLSLDCLHPWGCAGTSWDGGLGREGGNFHGNR